MTAADLLFVAMAVAAVLLTGCGFATEFRFWDAMRPERSAHPTEKKKDEHR